MRRGLPPVHRGLCPGASHRVSLKGVCEESTVVQGGSCSWERSETRFTVRSLKMVFLVWVVFFSKLRPLVLCGARRSVTQLEEGAVKSDT